MLAARAWQRPGGCGSVHFGRVPNRAGRAPRPGPNAARPSIEAAASPASSAIERSGPIASVVEVVDLEDPTQAGPFALRIQAPAGYTVPPRWHPTTENLTVLSGAVAIGMDDKTDIAAMTTLPAGGFVVLPAEMRHVFLARTAATIQIHGMGPFAITYVNPADDPRPKK